MTQVPRYYAACGAVRREFLSQHINAWQVYDRDKTSPQGEVRAIALCLTRDIAFAIRDALNVKVYQL